MRLSIFLSAMILFFLNEASAGEASFNRIYKPMKPHDHTDRALEIMTKRDVMRYDYGAEIYTRHCARCHGLNRHGKVGPKLSHATLGRFETISALFLYVKKGCSGNGTPTFGTLGDVALIFAARYIKRPLESDTTLSATGVQR